MQGLVTIDFGNSHPHAGLFSRKGAEWELLKVVRWEELGPYLKQMGMSPHNTSLVLAEVKPREEELQPFIEQGYLLTRVKDYWRGERFAGMPVNYAKSLGEDRLIEAFYCYKKNQCPTLIIDAGTYVTMDLINQQGFEGGYIIPGAAAYFESFKKGEQLKGVELQPDVPSSLPHETHTAMVASYGAFGALANEMIREHQIQKVVLTGGLSALWESFFQQRPPSLIVEKEPHLIHWSLQYWMTTQIEPL